MTYIVDRIEGDIAVCYVRGEAGKRSPPVDIPLSMFAGSVKECDVVYSADGKYFVDEDTTKALKESAKNRLDRLLQRPKKTIDKETQ